MRIRKIGPANRRAQADASKFPAFDSLTVESDMCFLLGDVSRAECGGGLPLIAFSRKCALESANASRQATGSRFKVLSPGSLTHAWCLGTQSDCDVAVDCLALRIRKIGSSNQRMRVARPRILALGALTSRLALDWRLETGPSFRDAVARP